MKLFYTWNDFDRDCFKLAEKLEEYKPFTLFGIPRGGKIVAVRLSHLTGMKYLDTIQKDTIIVDDIIQSGRSFGNLLHFLTPREDYKGTATLWVVREEIVRPNIWIRVKLEQDWVQFPWETEESSKYDGTILNVKEPEDYLTPDQLKERGFDGTTRIVKENEEKE